MQLKSKRRWVRFSLSTFLLGVTLLCVWLGWQVSIIRQRSASLSLAMQSGVSYTISSSPRTAQEIAQLAGQAKGDWQTTQFGTPTSRRFQVASNPWHRQLLGDKSIAFIRLPRSLPEAEVQQLDRLFPEATLYYVSNRGLESYVPGRT